VHHTLDLIKLHGHFLLANAEEATDADDHGRHFAAFICQAFAFAGAAAEPDPACAKSSLHAAFTAVASARPQPTYRHSHSATCATHRHCRGLTAGQRRLIVETQLPLLLSLS
jgi:hypothetical protein